MTVERKYERLTAAAIGAEESSASERARKKERLRKDHKASETPRSISLVSRAYENTLILEAMPSRYRGLASIFGAFLLASVWVFGDMTSDVVSMTYADIVTGRSGWWWILFDTPMLLASATLDLISIVVGLRILRFDLLAPKVIPLVFNRKTRKVYRFAQDVPGMNLLVGSTGRFSLSGLGRYIAMTFLPWPKMLLVEYDWDCLEAEYYETTGPSGNVIRTDHYLDLYVRETPGSDKVIGSFSLAPSILIGKESARDLWEHVRRFMEENGPALSPGDKAAPPPPKGFWQAANAIFAGPGWLIFLGIVIWKRDLAYYELLYWILPHGSLQRREALDMSTRLGMDAGIVVWAALFLSCFFLAGVFFAVIASYLSPAVELPPELTADAGAPIDLDALARASATSAARFAGRN